MFSVSDRFNTGRSDEEIKIPITVFHYPQIYLPMDPAVKESFQSVLLALILFLILPISSISYFWAFDANPYLSFSHESRHEDVHFAFPTLVTLKSSTCQPKESKVERSFAIGRLAGLKTSPPTTSTRSPRPKEEHSFPNFQHCSKVCKLQIFYKLQIIYKFKLKSLTKFILAVCHLWLGSSWDSKIAWFFKLP